MKLQKIKQIVGERIILRRLKLTDISSITENANDKRVAKYMGNLPYPYKLRDAKKWVLSTLKKKDGYDFGIALKDTGKVVGGIGIHHIDKKSDYKTGEIGYWLGKKYWRKGYGREACTLLLNFVFKKLNLLRVYARVFEPNFASHRLLKSLGFKEEGRLRKHQKNRFGKGWMDEFYSGILKDEWKGRIN